MSLPHGLHFAPTQILVPIDFSSSSDAALETAAELAQHYNAALHLLHVVPQLTTIPGTDYPADYFPEREFVEDARKQAEERLSACVLRLMSRGLRTRSCVEKGNDIVDFVLVLIDREKIDLVVLSTHGVSGWRAMVFGSIAEKLVKLIQCPLLLLRSVKTVPVS